MYSAMHLCAWTCFSDHVSGNMPIKNYEKILLKIKNSPIFKNTYYNIKDQSKIFHLHRVKMSFRSKPRKRQWAGFFIGGYITVVMSIVGFSGLFESFVQKGPMNTGHETLECKECHLTAPGTFRQQVQASLKYALNVRETKPYLGHLPVKNQVCLDCHDRPEDRHPVFRFIEPRFAKAREKIQPHSCLSCHMEHMGRRVTIEPDYCMHCHAKLSLKKDPLDIAHHTLIEEKKWNTCLRCHDFHGNHIFDTATHTSKMIAEFKVMDYFQGAPSPYSSEKRYEAKKQKE